MTTFQPITPLVEPTYQALLIKSTQQAVEIAEAIQSAMIAGKITSGLSHMTDYPDGSKGWIVQITVLGELFTAYQYDWLIQDSENNLSLWHGGSQWKGTNPEFADKWPVPELVWAATTEAPTAVAGAEATATITFAPPTSENAPFTYTVAQTDTTTDTTSEAALAGPPVLGEDGNVTLTVTGLTDGNQYTFTPSAATPYEGVTATALPTAAITAVA
jgi:hypothetical protein